jgi:hypothetical protein
MRRGMLIVGLVLMAWGNIAGQADGARLLVKADVFGIASWCLS